MLNATVSGGDVGESLFSCAPSPNLLGTLHGFSIQTSLSRRFCFSHTTTCAMNLPALSNESMVSALLRSRTGASSAETMLVYTEGCYEKIGGSTRPPRSTRASSESANKAEVTL